MFEAFDLANVDWSKVANFTGSWWHTIGPIAWIGATGVWYTVRKHLIPLLCVAIGGALAGYRFAKSKVKSDGDQQSAKHSPLYDAALILCQDGARWKYAAETTASKPKIVHTKGSVLKFYNTDLRECVLGGLDIMPRLSRSERGLLKKAALSCLEEMQLRLSI